MRCANLRAMNIPQDLLYSKDHEWVRVEGDVATVGITDFAQSELGDIVFVEVETVDEELDGEEVFGTIEAVKTVSDLFMPVPGTVAELNEGLEDNPALINEDPTAKAGLSRSTRRGGPLRPAVAEAYAAEVGDTPLPRTRLAALGHDPRSRGVARLPGRNWRPGLVEEAAGPSVHAFLFGIWTVTGLIALRKGWCVAACRAWPVVVVVGLAVGLDGASGAFAGRGRMWGRVADVFGLIAGGFAFRALYLEWPVGKRTL